MIDEQLVHIVESHAGEIAGQWAREICASRFTPTYSRFSHEELTERSRRVYENLGNWLDMDTGSDEISREYTQLGRTRYLEGFPLSEVLYGLHITKKVMWRHIMSSGVLNSALEIYRALDLIVRLFHFYDLAAFFIARGYQDALYQALKKESGQTSANLEEVLRREMPVGTLTENQAGVRRNWLESWNLFKTR
ncbi:MAG: RsbRD N-terminal domain-containing protein [Candidatus Aminicenantes bacterium]|nr:RsbRD N-terminal domain-containing protein [Candidatus Aminicenantes bacterium]